jgi:hypothetical protein
MKTLVSWRAARVLLALTLVVAPLGAWTAALPAAGGPRAERVVAQVLPGGEQVVQADWQPLSRVTVDRRGGLGRARSVLLGILVGTGLLGVLWRWWGRGGRTIHNPRRGVTPAYASRAPPRLRTA